MVLSRWLCVVSLFCYLYLFSLLSYLCQWLQGFVTLAISCFSVALSRPVSLIRYHCDCMVLSRWLFHVSVQRYLALSPWYVTIVTAWFCRAAFVLLQCCGPVLPWSVTCVTAGFVTLPVYCFNADMFCLDELIVFVIARLYHATFVLFQCCSESPWWNCRVFLCRLCIVSALLCFALMG